jgi:hypothetical protein
VERAKTAPSHVRPEVIAVMRELSMDISAHHEARAELAGQTFNVLISCSALWPEMARSCGLGSKRRPSATVF